VWYSDLRCWISSTSRYFGRISKRASIMPALLALPPTVKNAFSPNVSSIHFRKRVFACPGGPTNRICTGSEFKDLRKVPFIRSLNSEPVHILLVGPPGQAKTLFLKCILETFGEKAFFTVGGNASKAGMIDALFEMRPKYLLVDEIQHLKSEYQT